MMKKLPKALILYRFFMAFVLVALSYWKSPHYPLWATLILATGLLSDVFDGMIARKHGVSTEKLRRLDSSVDQVFFGAAGLATYLHATEFFKTNWVLIAILMGAEIGIYLISYVRFKKEVATHSIGAKIWLLSLFALLIQLSWKQDAGWVFYLCFWLGMITRIEIALILLILKEWTNDVPSVFQAIKLRKGEAIKRNKLFNG